MHRNPHCERKAVGRTIDDPAMQILGARVANGVKHEVEASPFGGNLFKNRLELPGDRNVAGTSDLATQFQCKRARVSFRLLVQIGDCELSARGAEAPRTTESKAMLIRHADNQPLLSRQHPHALLLSIHVKVTGVDPVWKR